MKRAEKEGDFRKNLEEFKSPGFQKLPFECSTMQFDGRFEIQALRHFSRNRAAVTITSIYLYIYSKELIRLKVLNFRRFFRINVAFIYYKIETYHHCKGR